MTRVRTFSLSLVAASVAAGALLVPQVGQAQRRSPLEGQPVVRHKMELRDLRFELAPTFEMSVASDYKQMYSFGVKGEYHLSDMLSVGGMFFYGVAANTGLATQIYESLPAIPQNDPTPTQQEFEDHLNTIPLHGAVHATVTPWFGKMAVFGKAYVNFDIYLQGGLALAQTKNNWTGQDGIQAETCYQTCLNDPNDPSQGTHQCEPYPCNTNPNNDGPQNSGLNPGLMLGAGIHAFVNRWIAVDLGVHDYMFSDNPSGLDYDADGEVSGDDKRLVNHLYFSLGASFYLPPKIKISR